MEDGIREIDIRRVSFRMNCGKCGQEIKGTSRKQLKHNYGLHLIYCKGEKKEETNEKQ